MKTANDVVKGRIVDVSETGVITIKAQYDDWFTLIKRGYKECNVQMIDSRRMSDKQRKTCYSLINAISEWSGECADRTKDRMKIKFLTEDLATTADKLFSLSNSPMSLVCAFERFLVRFMLDWDVPCNFSLLQFADDTADYIYSCLINKKCCICGKSGADLHHIDRVGIGRDRHDIIHEGMEALPLCREHHGEAHTTGDKSLFDKYHFESGIQLDKTLCRIYGLKRRNTNERI